MINIIRRCIDKGKLIPDELKCNASQDYANKPPALIHPMMDTKMVSINGIKHGNKEKMDPWANWESMGNALIAEYSSA